jgi:hypothetical protein
LLHAERREAVRRSGTTARRYAINGFRLFEQQGSVVLARVPTLLFADASFARVVILLFLCCVLMPLVFERSGTSKRKIEKK